MSYYSAIDRNEVLVDTRQMNEPDVLSERSQTQGHIVYDSIYRIVHNRQIHAGRKTGVGRVLVVTASGSGYMLG